MLSPFPGMDPFLEVHWGDVHTRLATSISIELRKQHPNGLVARLETSVVLETAESEPIDQNNRSVLSSRSDSAGVVVAEPQLVAPRLLPRQRHSVQILDAEKKMRLVTAIEIISPGNKIGLRNREEYQTRAERILNADASLVEIDLLRRGHHVVQSRPQLGQSHYSIAVSRAWKLNRVEYYAARFDAPLPTIRIPLRRNDGDVFLELQKLIAQAYFDGSYEDTDYTQPLKPPFSSAEKKWLKVQLKKRG